MVALKQVTKNFISEVMEENWNKYREAQQDQADFQCSIYIKKKNLNINYGHSSLHGCEEIY